MEQNKFIFPTNKRAYQTILSVNKLKQQLQYQAKVFNLIVPYEIREIGIHLVVQCSLCTAKLLYQRRQNKFELKKCQDRHVHQKKLRKDQIETNNRFDDIIQEPATIQVNATQKETFNKIMIELGNQNPLEHRQMIMKSLGISGNRFSTLLNQFRLEKKLKQSREKLSQLELFFVHIKQTHTVTTISHTKISGQQQEIIQKSLPNILIIQSPSMKLALQQFHKSISFQNLKEKFIKQQNFFGKPKITGGYRIASYHVSILSSFNRYGKFVILALIISNIDNKYGYAQIFADLITKIGQSPETIFTDYHRQLKLAIIQLQNYKIFQGYHYYNAQYFIKRYKIDQKSQYFTKAHKLAQSYSSGQFYIRMTDLQEQLQNPNNAPKNYDNFRKAMKDNKHECILPFMANKFVGLNYFEAKKEIQKIIRRIKQYIPQQKSYVDALKILLQICERSNHQSQKFVIWKRPFQDYFGQQIFKKLRYSFAKPILKILLRQIYLTSRCDVISVKTSEKSVVIKDQFEQLELFFEDEKPVCPCGYEAKIGLPCLHQLKVCFYKKMDIIKYFGGYWNINNNQGQLTYTSEITNAISDGRQTLGKLAQSMLTNINII